MTPCPDTKTSPASFQWLRQWWFLLVATAMIGMAFVRMQSDLDHHVQEPAHTHSQELLSRLQSDLAVLQERVDRFREDISRLERYIGAAPLGAKE